MTMMASMVMVAAIFTAVLSIRLIFLLVLASATIAIFALVVTSVCLAAKPRVLVMMGFVLSDRCYGWIAS